MKRVRYASSFYLQLINLDARLNRSLIERFTIKDTI
jgi:hypothetical protein